jgi:LacI family transcriptional regulator
VKNPRETERGAVEGAGAAKPPARPSIHDVARTAGVSTATVSNVFNRPQIVAEPTLLRVRDAVAAVGYVPDGAARVMRGALSPVVGCVLLDVANIFYGEIFRGIEDTLRPLGFLALIGSSDVDAERERGYLQLMRSQRVRGIILNPTGDGPQELPDIPDGDLPIVLVDHGQHGKDLCAVTADNELGGYLLARHLIGLGHRTLTLIWPPQDVEATRQREAGVRRACAESGTNPGIRLNRVENDTNGDPLIEDLVRRILREDPDTTALICFNDMTALRVLQCLRRQGVSVPETISVTGYDDLASCALLTPALTTIRQPAREMGQLAARLVLSESDPAHRHEERVLGVDLMVRESTAAPARRL